MNRLWRRVVIAFVVLALVFPARPARADSIHNAVVGAVVAIVAVTAAITVGIVLAVKHHPSVTGCVSRGTNGLELESEGDRTAFLLTGDTADIKAGERVKVQGTKNGKDALGGRRFFVQKVKRDYGTCTLTP